MNREQTFEVLQTCLLAVDGADLSYMLKQGFNSELAKVGLKLCFYLKSKEITFYCENCGCELASDERAWCDSCNLPERSAIK